MQDILSHRMALVTGASGGIGAAICRELAAAGADVAMHYHRHREQAASLAAKLRAVYPGRQFPVVQADISCEGDVDRMFDYVLNAFGALHILVNNAGIICDRTLKKAQSTAWRSVIDVDLIGQAFCCRRAAQCLKAGGRIINIASIIGFTGNFGQTNYAAAKAGLIGLTKSLAQELASREITVNAIAPGFVETPLTAAMPDAERERWTAKSSVKRFAKPEEISWAALFLAAPRASYVTGTVVHVNGGTY